MNNWMDGVSDEAYYPWESPKKIRLKSVNPTFFNSSINVNLPVSQNHRKKAKINVVFHHFPSLGQKEPP